MTRIFSITVVCLLLGFLLGRWTPAGELARVREEMKALKKAGRGNLIGSDTAATAARGFLRIDPSEVPAPPPAETEEPGHVHEVAASGTDPVEPVPAADTNEVAGVDEVAERQEDFADQMEKAKELWEVRSELARNSFLQNVKADEEATLRFDVLVESMNLRLNNTIEQWVDKVSDQEMIRAEEGARLMHDLTGAIVLTYDEMDRSMPDGWREDSGSEFKLFDFIDPNVAQPLIDVEGRMQQFEP